jgi:hypothetical protein
MQQNSILSIATQFLSTESFNWPSRLPNPKAAEFFLWGYFKGKLHATRPVGIPYLEQEFGSVV